MQDPQGSAAATGRLHISPLGESDIEPLAQGLWHEEVYHHIGGLPEARSEVSDWLRHTLAGPPSQEPPQRWLNYVMRRAPGEAPVGLLQATLHGGVAEVAYLLLPSEWGQGLAGEGLRWLHEVLARVAPEAHCWATTVPANERSWRLLERCGYVRAAPPEAPALMSYEEGDWVFRRALPPQGPGAAGC
ncbi:GNAT family N-acetyltransferase [Mitsuaria sp. WAJ17]|uniref:GNAT family N-acetyltransferase n=1 Tax=Mitsuaria sp. WAJ17 TaxID=2761452 RepID=UPI0015FFFF12|nr:GNAT family N-acetyltransferase [Mitsuaria sp. WAJ17]MBB2486140.1 GNAT family N-acetyltransferase [Mitsuaria sp. WAJ17]